MSEDVAWMREALRLGTLAMGRTSPNPPVGAVVVRDGKIVGRGATAPVGGPHAEVTALREAGDLAAGATLVCTLEPCAHQGRTGPCADAIIDAGVTRVVYAVPDPTEQAAGGHRRLADAGVSVVSGLLGEAAAGGALRAWLHLQQTGRPFVIWKVAQSLDGQVAAEDGSSKWITGPTARADVHELRAQVDAIVAGAGTVRADDPELTVRHPGGERAERQPLRVIVSNSGRLPDAARVLDGSVPTLVALGPDTSQSRVGELAERVATWRSPGRPGEAIDLPELLDDLRRRGVLSVLIEGGPTLAGSFLADDLVDEVRAYIAPKLLVSGMWPALRGYGIRSIDEAIDLAIVDVQQCGDDVRITATRRQRPAERK